MRSIFSLFSLLVFSANFCTAQHAEVNLFEKSSHIKYADYQVEKFKKDKKLSGLTFHLLNQGRVVYSKAMGFEEFRNAAPMTLNSVRPLSDSTRLFTSTAILHLLQEGKVSLEDRVFGPNSFFENDIPKVHKNIAAINIRYLLDRTAYLQNKSPGTDKIMNMKIAATRYKKVIEPGQSTAENIFTYYVLGRVIEKVSGQSYTEYVQNMTKGIFRNEMIIPDRKLEKKEIWGNQSRIVTVNSATGDSMYGIYCSAGDLTNFVLSIDGYPAVKDLLIPTAVKISKTQSRVVPEKGLVWSIGKDCYYMNSSYASGHTVIKLRNDGVGWVITSLGGDNNFCKEADELPLKIIKRVRKLP